MRIKSYQQIVIPAKAGIFKIPAFAGMTALMLAIFLTLSLTPPAYAVQPDEMLANPAQEQRARELSKDLRCLVCQNQSIDDSNADLAHDLRVLLRQRITAGDSDAQAKQYLVERYGDYVLLTPPFKTYTLVLWASPILFLLLALILARPFYKKRNEQEKPLTPLSAEEDQRLAALSSNIEQEKAEKL